MIHTIIPWALCLLGVVAMGQTRDPGLTLSTVVLIAVGCGTKRLIGRKAGTLAVLVVMGIVLSTDLSRHDRLAIATAMGVIHFVPGLAVEAMVASSTLFVMAEARPDNALYTLLTFIYGVLLFAWFVLERRSAFDEAAPGAPRAPRPWLAIGLCAVMSTGLAGITAVGLPVASRWATGLGLASGAVRTSGFSMVTDLSSLAELKTSHQVALRVFAPTSRYLRGQVYSTYKYGRWISTSGDQHAITTPEAGATEDAPGSRDRVENEMPFSPIVFAPLEARDVVAPGLTVRRTSQGVLTATGGALAGYSYRFSRRPVTADGWGAPGDFLAIPPEIRQELATLAASWTSGASTTEAKVAAVHARLSGFRYTLRPGAPGTRDPVLRFLLQTRAGHCEYFASAMTLLLRSAGVPARYVTGYSVEGRSPFGTYLLARDCDAHAWVEVWAGGRGWVTRDPTPGSWRADESIPGAAWVRDLWDHLLYRWGLLTRRIGAIGAVVLAWMGGLTGPGGWGPAWRIALCLALGWVLRRRLRSLLHALRRAPSGRSDQGPVDQEAARRALAQLERALASIGLARSPTTTPAELLISLTGRNRDLPATRSCEELIDLFCRTRYRGDAWDAARARTLLDAVHRALQRRRPVI